MALRNYAKRWNFKPPIGTQLNTGHSLSAGLIGAWPINEGAGNKIYNAVDGRVATFNGTVGWVPSAYGTVPGFVFNTGNWIDAPRVPIMDNLGALTVFQLIYIKSLQNGASTGTGLYKKTPNIYVTGTSAATSAYFVEISTNNAFPEYVTNTGVFAFNTWYATMFTWGGLIGTANQGNIYINGQLQSLATNLSGAGTQTNDNAVDVFIANDGGGSFSITLDGSIAVTYMWNRVLSAREAWQLYIDPWAMFNPMSPRINQVQQAPIATSADRWSPNTNQPYLTRPEIVNY